MLYPDSYILNSRRTFTWSWRPPRSLLFNPCLVNHSCLIPVTLNGTKNYLSWQFIAIAIKTHIRCRPVESKTNFFLVSASRYSFYTSSWVMTGNIESSFPIIQPKHLISRSPTWINLTVIYTSGIWRLRCDT